MYLDFHTHGKLAKYLPFSIAYTNWLLNEAKNFGLDAICLTEHSTHSNLIRSMVILPLLENHLEIVLSFEV